MFSNFIADKESSETYGIMCVNFGTTSGAETVSGGSETELNIGKTPRSNNFYIISQEYSKPLSFNFQIINTDGSNIDESKERTLKKWLCKRGKYVDFQIDNDRFNNIMFQVNISNPQLIKVGEVVGMEFSVNFKYPFGHYVVNTKPYNITTVNQQIKLYINNDDDGYIYPDIIITANSSGSLSIANSTEVPNRIFTINNLIVGEVITIKGGIPDISSSISNHAVWSDFNKHWIRFIDGWNTITVNKQCSITFNYKEPRKVGI
jgi:hypothetical protein